MLNNRSLGLFQKGMANCKQSRIKGSMWHLRWLVSTRDDISLWPSELVRSRTDIKFQPSKNRDQYQVAANWIGKVIRRLILEQINVHAYLF